MSDFNKYECVICGFIYDESVGIPDDGIPAGTKWADIPEDWECPDCGISKFDFDLLED
jgi:rubredoxin